MRNDHSSMLEIASAIEQVELVGKDDARYAGWCHRSKLRAEALLRGRLKDPMAVDHGKVMRLLERATLRHLSQACGVVPERVLVTPNTGDPRWGSYTFEEIDFVITSQGEPAVLGEMKTSVAPGRALRTGLGQIQRRLTKARKRWPQLGGVVICYSLDWLRTNDTESPTVLSEQELESRLISQPSRFVDEVQSFRVSGASLLRTLWASSLLPAGFKERLDAAYQALTNPLSILTPEAESGAGLLSLAGLFPN
jgi:hypothetical protein